MKKANSQTPQSNFEYTKRMVLDDFVRGDNDADAMLYVQIFGDTEFGISEGDFAVVVQGVKPTENDLVLYTSKGDHFLKKFSEIKKRLQPLRLVARNGKVVKSETPAAAIEIFGVVTHVLKTYGNLNL